MRAIVTQVIRNKVYTTSGKVVMDGINKISLIVIGKDGSSSIKSFNKSKCSIQKIDE